jgi:hypothetical protein
MEKRRGTTALEPAQRIGLADRVRADAIPNAAGGEGGHGAAKPDGVIHRYLFNKSNLSTCEPATKMEGFCLCFMRLSHTQPKQPLAALTVYDIHVT